MADKHRMSATALTTVMAITMITLTAATATDIVIATTAITLITVTACIGIAAINTRVIERPRTTHNKPRDEYRRVAGPTSYHPFPPDMIIR